MSASMAEVLAKHHIAPLNEGGWGCYCETDWDRFEDAAAHQAEQLAANGFGDVREARAKALEDAAAVLARLPYVSPLGQGRETYEHMLAVRRGNTDGWLIARAAEERKP